MLHTMCEVLARVHSSRSRLWSCCLWSCHVLLPLIFSGIPRLLERAKLPPWIGTIPESRWTLHLSWCRSSWVGPWTAGNTCTEHHEDPKVGGGHVGRWKLAGTMEDKLRLRRCSFAADPSSARDELEHDEQRLEVPTSSSASSSRSSPTGILLLNCACRIMAQICSTGCIEKVHRRPESPVGSSSGWIPAGVTEPFAFPAIFAGLSRQVPSHVGTRTYISPYRPTDTGTPHSNPRACAKTLVDSLKIST